MFGAVSRPSVVRPVVQVLVISPEQRDAIVAVLDAYDAGQRAVLRARVDRLLTRPPEPSVVAPAACEDAPGSTCAASPIADTSLSRPFFEQSSVLFQLPGQVL